MDFAFFEEFFLLITLKHIIFSRLLFSLKRAFVPTHLCLHALIRQKKIHIFKVHIQNISTKIPILFFYNFL